MDHASRMRSLLATCAWVKDGDWLRAIGPELLSALPPLVAASELRDDGHPSIPVTFGADLWPALCATLAEVTLHALDRPDASAFGSLSDDAVLSDPLVAALVPIVASIAAPGLRAGAVPALAVAWCASRALGGRVDELVGVPEATVRAVRGAVGRLDALDAFARGAVLARVASAIAIRHAAAWEVVRRGGLSLPEEPLGAYVLAHPLAVGVPRGAFGEGIPFELLAGAFDVATDPALVRALTAAATAARVAVDRRRAARKPAPADLVLERLAPGAAPEALLLHPAAGPFLVASLPSLVEASDLKAARLSGPVAKALREPLALRALAAALADLARPALEWDWLSSVIDRVVPLRRSAERWFSARGPAPGGGRWGLMVPRGPSESGDRAVAAVRLSSLREAIGESARARQLGDAGGAVERAWEDLALESGAVAFAWVADHGVAAFPGVDAAVRFAERAQRGLSGPRELLVGAHGARVEVMASVQVSVGIDVGRLFGGTDGSVTVLTGPAIGMAIALAGAGAPEAGAADDPLGMREVQVGGLGLRSHGILCSDAAARALVDGARRRGQGVHEQGTAETVAGLSTDFRRYPVFAWFDAGEDECHLLLRLGSGRGPAELKRLSTADLRRFHADDARQWAMEHQRPAASVGWAPEDDAFASAPAASARDAMAPEPEPEVVAPADDLAAFFGFAPSAGAAGPEDSTARMPMRTGLDSGFSLLDSGPSGAPPADPFTHAEPGIAFFGPGPSLTPPPGPDPAPPMLIEIEVGDLVPAPPMLIEVAGPPMLLDDAAPESPPPVRASAPMTYDGASVGDVEVADDADDAVLDAEAALVSDADPYAALTGAAVEVLDDDGGEGDFSVEAPFDPFRPSAARAAEDEPTDGGGFAPAVSVDDDIDEEETDALIDAAWARSGPVTPTPPPAPPQGWASGAGASTPASSELAAAVGGTAEQLSSLFEGYMMAEEDECLIFGLRDAVTLRDAHRFDRGPGGVAAAYTAFVDAKIRESFLPQADLVYWVPPDVRVRALDIDLLAQAWKEVVG